MHKNFRVAFSCVLLLPCTVCLTGCNSDEAYSVVEDASETELAEIQAMIDQGEQATQQSSTDAAKQPSKR